MGIFSTWTIVAWTVSKTGYVWPVAASKWLRDDFDLVLEV